MNELISNISENWEVAKIYFEQNIGYWYGLNILLGMCFASCIGLIVARWPAKMKYEEDLMFVNYWEEKGENLNNEHYLSCKKNTEKKPDGFFFPGSRCDSCGHNLKLWHNIPIIGWLSLGGKCAFCKTKIPFSVLGAEILGGAIGFLVAFLIGEVSIYTFMWLIIAAYISAVSWLDWKTLYLPTASLCYFTFVIFLLSFQNLNGSFIPNVEQSLAGAMTGFATLFIINEGYYLLRGIKGFGEGDYYLLGALGACLGVEKIISTIIISVFVGVILYVLVSLFNIITKKEKSENGKIDLTNNKITTVDEKTAMPFGPSISIASLITIILFKFEIIQHYFIM